MKLRHLFYALVVVVIWGLSFTVAKIGIRELPPLTLCVIRLFLVSVPAVLFLKRPSVSYLKLMSFGLCMFAMQFGFLISGMYMGVTAGLAALILQTHVFFTIGLAIIMLKEPFSLWQIIAALVSFSGIILLASHAGGEVTVPGFLCIVAAAGSWGIANIILRRIGPVDVLALLPWSCLIAWPPLACLAILFEGWDLIKSSIEHITMISVISVLYLTYPVIFLAFAIWSKLLSLYPAITVAPLTLLVPIVAIACSYWILDENLNYWKLVSAGLVIGGLSLNAAAPLFSKQL